MNGGASDRCDQNASMDYFSMMRANKKDDC
jgi:hypothetical protein